MNRYCYENKMYDIKLNNLEKAIMDEIIFNIEGYSKEDREKLEKTDILKIARDIIEKQFSIWELLNGTICNYLDREVAVEQAKKSLESEEE